MLLTLIRMHEAIIPGLRLGGTHPANRSCDIPNLNHDPLSTTCSTTGAESNTREKQKAGPESLSAFGMSNLM